ncbi:MAG: hypothetical protein P1V36_11045 [Planctomycetota bacterium]|nr:hypothetical protein [Planctomycetota bacterium]
MPSQSNALRNTLAYAVPELFWGMAWALAVDGPMVAAYRDAFGGGPSFVAVTWLVGSLAIGLPSLLSALWVEPMKHKRAFVFWGHIAGGIALLAAAGAIYLWAGSSTTAACVAYILGTGSFFLSIGILMPGWLALVGELFQGGMQSRVLGITFVSNKLAAIFGGQLIAQAVLGTAWTPTDQWSLMFLIAGAAALVGSFPFLWLVEVPRPRPPRMRLGPYFRSLLDVLRELPALRRFIVSDVLGIALMLVLTYAADAAIRDGGFPRKLAGHWVAVGAGGMLAMSALVAIRARHVHPRTWFLCGTAAGIVAALAAAYGSTNVADRWGGAHLGYDVAAAGVGVYMGVRASCHAPLVMRLSPGRDGTAPIGVSMACIMLMQGGAPVIGALVIAYAGYLPLFLGVAVCGTISLILLWLRVPLDVVNRERGNQVSESTS